LVPIMGFAREEGAGGDFADYLLKPVDPAEVLRVLAGLRPGQSGPACDGP
jgi:hypothetical protein